MGQYVKLNDKTNNSDLPKLVNYDTTQLLAQITALKSCRAFYDFTDLSQMTVDGSNDISQVNDLSGNDLHATSTGGLRPSFDPSALGGSGGAVFTDAEYMNIAGLFNGPSRYTVVTVLKPSGRDGVSRIFLSDSDNGAQNFYLAHNSLNTNLRAVSANLDILTDDDSGSMDYFASVNIVDAFHEMRSGELSDTSTAALSVPSGDAYIGRWNDGTTSANWFVGEIGHMAVFNEAIFGSNGDNEILLAWLKELNNVKYGI